MDTDELETLLEDKLAARDAAKVEQTEDLGPADSIEDFVSRSG
jgi:hypothetical protein